MVNQFPNPNRLMGSEASGAHIHTPRTSLTQSPAKTTVKTPPSSPVRPHRPITSLLESPEMNGNEREIGLSPRQQSACSNLVNLETAMHFPSHMLHTSRTATTSVRDVVITIAQLRWRVAAA